MAFFGDETADEIRKLKKQIGAQGVCDNEPRIADSMAPLTRSRKLCLQTRPTDLKIGSLEAERTAHIRQAKELEAVVAASLKRDEASAARETASEETIARLRSDLAKLEVQETNLRQALDKAHEKESEQLKGQRLQEDHRDRAIDLQKRIDNEQRQELECRLHTAEARIHEQEGEIQRLHQQSNAGRQKGDAATVAALESEIASLKADNIRLKSVEHAISSKVGSPGSFPRAGEASSNPRRRPRSSSVSAPAGCSDATQAHSQAQLEDLHNIHTETLADLAKVEARAEKAEREALKAVNEAMANKRQGDKMTEQLSAELRELKLDLDLSRGQVSGLAQELSDTESKLEIAEAQVQSLEERLAEGKSMEAKATESKLITDELNLVKSNFAELKSDYRALQKRSEEAEATSASLRKELEMTASALVEAQQSASGSSTPRSLDGKGEEMTQTPRRVRREPRSSTQSPHDAFANAEVDRLAHQIKTLRQDVEDKDAMLEQAEALSEEDGRQLRLKESERKQLAQELTRIRRKLREAELEIEVYRSSSNDEEVETALGQLKQELSRKDDEMLALQKEAKLRANELEAGKKQLKCLADAVASGQRSQNSVCDADASLAGTPRQEQAQTPISKLLKAKHYFATPGGRPVQRSFDEDLLDHVGLMRDSLAQAQQQQDFIELEQKLYCQRLSAEVQTKDQEIEELRAELQSIRVSLDEDGSDESRKAISEQVGVDLRAHIQELTQRLGDSETLLQSAQAALHTAQTEYLRKEEETTEVLAQLRTKLQDSETRAKQIISISLHLDAKRQQLLSIEQKRSVLRGAEQELENVESQVSSTEGRIEHEKTTSETWLSQRDNIATTFASHLASLKNGESTSSPAVHHDPSPATGRSSFGNASQEPSNDIKRLQRKIAELDGRILRREEQIGKQQLQIQSLTTKLAMVEEDYEELLEEKMDLESEVAKGQSNIEQAVSQHSEAQRQAQRENEQANDALREATRKLEAELQKVAELEEQRARMERDAKKTSEEAEDQDPHHSLSQELAEARALLEAVESDLRHAQEDLQQAEDRANEKDSEAKKLRMECDDLTRQSENLMQRLSVSQSAESEAMEQLRDSYAAEQQRWTAEAHELQGRLNELEEQVQRQTAQRADSDRQLDNCRSEFAEAVQEAVEARELLMQASTERAAQFKELEHAREELNSQQEELRRLEAACDDLRSLASQKQADRAVDADTETALRDDLAKAQENESVAVAAQAELQSLVSQLQAAVSEEKANVETLSAAVEDWRVKASRAEQAEQAVEAAHVLEATLRADLGQSDRKLVQLEASLTEREQALAEVREHLTQSEGAVKMRNEDYWQLKEELAELQEQQERSRIVGQTVEQLEQKLRQFESELANLESTRHQLSESERALANAEQRLAELERDSSAQTSQVADLQGELKRRKAAARSNEEELQALRDELDRSRQELDGARQECTLSITQLQAAKTSEDKLRRELTAAQAEVSAAAQRTEASASAAEVEEELSYLKSRITELETELEAKADEVENADGRILDGLKENKKLASKIKTLQKQLIHLQEEVAKSHKPSEQGAEAGQQPVPEPVQQASIPSKPALAPAQPKEQISVSDIPSTSSPNLSRKRPSPEDDTHEEAPSSNRARAVYLPTSNGKGGSSSSGFMPVRRTVAASSPNKAARLQDRTNVDRTTAGVKATEIDKAGAEKKPANISGNMNGGVPPTRRTLGGARPGAAVGAGGGSSDLMAALQAKRRLASAGRS